MNDMVCTGEQVVREYLQHAAAGRAGQPRAAAGAHCT